VEERAPSIEEQDERETIYQKHLDTQTALAATTSAVTATVAVAAAAVAGFDLAT